MNWYEDPAFLTTRRNLLGVTQKELAERANVDRSWLTMVEKGQINIGDAKLRAGVKLKRARVWAALADIENDREAMKPRPLSDLLHPEKWEEISRESAEFLARTGLDAKQLVRESQAKDARKEAKDPDYRRVSEMCRSLFADNKKLHSRISELQAHVKLHQELHDVQKEQIANLTKRCMDEEEISTLRHAQIEGLKEKLLKLGVGPEEIEELLNDPGAVKEHSAGD